MLQPSHDEANGRQAKAPRSARFDLTESSPPDAKAMDLFCAASALFETRRRIGTRRKQTPAKDNKPLMPSIDRIEPSKPVA
jgi:hypothetical protein